MSLFTRVCIVLEKYTRQFILSGREKGFMVLYPVLRGYWWRRTTLEYSSLSGLVGDCIDGENNVNPTPKTREIAR